MRPLDLLINGQPADLPASTKGLVKFSQARASLADVAARVGEYSFPLTLPPTRRNADIFGVERLHAQGLNKFGPFTDFEYELRAGGEVFAGTFRLTSLKNGYTGSLIGAGLSWALLLGESKLTDLVFPTVNYDGSQLENVMTLDCDSTDLQFPLVAYGNFFGPPVTRTQADGSSKEVPSPPAAVLDYPLSVDDYPPSVYYVNILRHIFAGIGWRLQGRELDSEFWRSVVMLPAGADVDKAWPWGALLPASANAPARGSHSESYYNSSFRNNAVGFFSLPGDGAALQGDVVFLPVVVSEVVSSPTRALDAPAASYTAPLAGTYGFTWSATLKSSSRQVFDGKNMNSGDPYVSALMKPVGLGLVVRRGGQDFTDGDGGLMTGDPNAGPLNYLPYQDRVLTPQRLDVANGSISALDFGQHSATVSVFLEAGDTVSLCAFARRVVNSGVGEILGQRAEFVLDFAAAHFACTSYADNDGVSKQALQPADFLPPLAQKEVVRDFLLRVDGFILADLGTRVATLVSRSELSTAGGEAIDLSELVDSRSVEYLPAAGADVGSVVFVPAGASEDPRQQSDDPLVPTATDIVRASIGNGTGEQRIESLFAVVGFRPVYFPNGLLPLLPTCSTKDLLAQNRSEVEWAESSQAPRLLRYVGTDTGQPVPFMQRTVPLARAAWDGPLAWDGYGGAVASYYQGTLRRMLHGHTSRVALPLTPGLYQQLQPGRRVYLFGAPHTVEALSNFDAADEASVAQLDLSREVG